MNRFIKTMTLAALVGCAAVTAASARGMGKNSNGNGHSFCNNDCGNNDAPGGRMGGMMMAGFDRNVSIGQVTDVSKDSLTYKDADGNKVTVKISPFTKIHTCEFDGGERRRGEADFISIEDVKVNDWVLISTYDSDTKTKFAERIIVKK